MQKNNTVSKSIENISTLKRFSTASSGKPRTAAVLNQLLPLSTPLDHHYEQLNLRFVTGYWKLYSAKSTLDGKYSTVFVFERKNNVKAPSRLGRSSRLSLIDLIRYDISQLASLSHPRLLRIFHDLQENKEMMAFASECVNANLEKFIAENGIDKLEIKLGILQIIDGLSYLHNSAKILHGNLVPNAIYITLSKQWKIGGFAFSVAAIEPNIFPCLPWTKKLPVNLQPDLDFLAPEYLAPYQNSVTAAADVFSLGVLICWICTGGKKLIDAKNNIETYDNLWFSRILLRFDEFLIDSYDLYAALSRPLFYMLDNCESHNIHRLKPWIRRIVDQAQQRSVRSIVLDNMNILFRRFSDEKVEDQLQDLIVMCIKSEDVQIQVK
ncbi:unnamed protein product [Thelazia callipaeda]|uniref:Protein kinase domain-containing protein n=1 Tax=Thelazia callipaeda TaxID=103827 RepID=A0A3P7L619_THECL|nr:unnamed protein product [Thelazia callipaeda]